MSAIEVVGVLHHLIELAALLIELMAVAVILAAVLMLAVKRGTIRYVYQVGATGAYEIYKHQLGKALLMGLEHCVPPGLARMGRTLVYETGNCVIVSRMANQISGKPNI